MTIWKSVHHTLGVLSHEGKGRVRNTKTTVRKTKKYTILKMVTT